MSEDWGKVFVCAGEGGKRSSAGKTSPPMEKSRWNYGSIQERDLGEKD